MATRSIVFLLFDGCELLDMAGPAAVFTTANALGQRERYVVTLASSGTSVRTGGGLELAPSRLSQVALSSRTTLLVVGAYGTMLARAMAARSFDSIFTRGARSCERIGSVCSGAFLLARTGLLDGHRATTHWAGTSRFETMFPRVRLEPDALYVRDRNRWTSAGVTTGIDMALAMVAHDHGNALRARVARQLVVYAHRPGHQSQFSSMLDAQTRAGDPFAELIEWTSARLDRPPSIQEMASRVGMSERNFLRKFKAATGEVPSRCLEKLRIEHARLSLESGTSVKQTAARVGFRSEAAFRTLFTARIGVSPSHYAKLHGPRGPRA